MLGFYLFLKKTLFAAALAPPNLSVSLYRKRP